MKKCINLEKHVTNLMYNYKKFDFLYRHFFLWDAEEKRFFLFELRYNCVFFSYDTNRDSSPPKKPKTGDQSSVPPPPTASTQSSYQYSSGPSGPYQSQQQFQSGQYGSQGGYQQGYQQYPPPSDPNYANYQNWQYSQGGPQAYGPYNQWGSYNYY